ncbi:Gx transporter family protein [Streptococcus sp. CSL10205-OR2]|uniref:Gx transporter family protein n=1 Tax=Streptococcus sp. CSL10205-OR2 TaxID=2980558 RepID=UPI0021D8D8FF|nr:Gx transporter family protein [Streptococcus sp. CSL10205-OR2]MCU9533655.1 Gx transporter family protein [Streptococcus sp. CSL10205-OR2]
MTSKYYKLIFITMLASQAVVISLVERMIPTPFAFAPGAKLGLGNLVTIIALFNLSTKDSAKVIGLRLFITTFLSGTFSTFLYSTAGSVLSFIAMIFAKKLGPKRVSVIGISIFGGVIHNIGQLLVFSFIAQSFVVLNYLPILSFSGILSGLLVGLSGNYILSKVPRFKDINNQ